jgi:ATP-dependent DNA helicase RecQ
MRMQIARSRGVPPYVIFHDSTLRELARVKPRSLAELARVYGMGERKIEAHGAVVLETINAHA